MSLPLEGVRVIDLTNVVAGPLASYQLVMLGADVIKVELPATGDLARKMGASHELASMNMGASFLALNAGKKSLTLDLKTEDGKGIFKRMVKGADVVIENFRPGTMKRLELDHPVLKAINPSVIYCAVSGFGQDGPLAQRPSYDQIIQGFSGLMSLTGTERTAPMRSGYIVCDAMAAITAAFAICAALYRRKISGEGEMIDVAMLDASLASMAAWPISNYLNAGKTPRPMGNENLSASPSGTFKTGRGLLNIVNNEQKQWESLCEVIGRPELKTDARFIDRFARITRREELRTILEEALQSKSADEWEEKFVEAGVPAGQILDLPDILKHPHLEQRQLIRRFRNTPGFDCDIAVPRLGFRLSQAQPDVERPPPRLGEHTQEILQSIGYSHGEIEQFRAAKAI